MRCSVLWHLEPPCSVVHKPLCVGMQASRLPSLQTCILLAWKITPHCPSACRVFCLDTQNLKVKFKPLQMRNNSVRHCEMNRKIGTTNCMWGGGGGGGGRGSLVIEWFPFCVIMEDVVGWRGVSAGGGDVMGLLESVL